MDLSAAFATLAQMKACAYILEYSMSQSTLEQIFINFAKEQDTKEGGSGGERGH